MTDNEIATRRFNVQLQELALIAEKMAREANAAEVAEVCAAMVQLTNLSNQTGEQVNPLLVGNNITKLWALAYYVTYGKYKGYIELNKLMQFVVARLDAGIKPMALAMAIDPGLVEEDLQVFKHG